MDSLKNLFQNLSKKALIVIFSIIGLFIITVIAIIIYSINNRPHLTIRNFSNYAKTASGSIKSDVEKITWNQIKNTLNGIDAEKTYITDAVIRDNSYTETRSDNNINTASFLLDIESIKITYSISFSWSSDNEVQDGIIINCPKKSDSKYPETKCIGMYNNTNSIELYLPYESTLSNNEKFEAREGVSFDTNEFQVSIYVNACGFDKPLKEAEEKTKSYLKENDINIEKYNFEAIDVCTTHRGGE